MTEEKLLGLNIIVGPGEAAELEKCLKSCQGDLFDEIIITVTSEDKEVKAIADQYATKVPHYKWNDSFCDARNYSFSQNTTPYILWLDADDVIKPENYKKLLEIKPRLNEFDMVLLDYIYFHDDKDNSVVTLPRERIIKNNGKITWHDPIHEYLNMEPWMKICRVPIAIDHYRTKPYDPDRNITLLKRENDKPGCSNRLKFYYGKELFDLERYNEGIPILEKYIQEGDDYPDNLTIACIKLGTYFFSRKKFDQARTYAMKGIRFNNTYAENFVIVGDTHTERGEYDVAISYYKEALTKNLSGGMSQLIDYYGFIPLLRLAVSYSIKKDFRESKNYAKKALEIKPDNAQVKSLLRDIMVEYEKSNIIKIAEKPFIEELGKFLKDKNFLMNVEDNNADFALFKVIKSKEIDVVWMLPFSDVIDPSTRIRRINIDKVLRSKNIKSRIMHRYYEKSVDDVINEIGDASIVIFTSYDDKDFEIASILKQKRVKIIYDQCEAVFDDKNRLSFMKKADIIVSCSSKLQELTREKGYANTVVIKDAIEDTDFDTPHNYDKPSDQLVAGFFGMGGNSFLVTDYLRENIEKAGYKLLVCSEWDNATHKWTLDGWKKVMNECDVILCPQRIDVQPAKSNVKVTQAMALGMPVIASKIKSYEEVIRDSENGYLSNKKKHWYRSLVALKDPSKRKDMGLKAKESVSDYTQDAIANQWVEVFKSFENGFSFEENKPEVDEIKTRDQVDIIITNYNNVKYLKMCISSILLNTAYPYHIIISDAGSDEETWEYLRTLKGMTILGEPGVRLSYSEACNAGIEKSVTKYFVIFNSDIIVSKDWLNNLASKMETIPRLAACGVLSNCDSGWLSNAPGRPTINMKLKKSGIELHPGMKIEDMEDHIEELYEFMGESNKEQKDKYVPQSWVAGYATIYARCAINEVGLFDTIYKNGCEDLDLCIRLQKCGYAMGQSWDSFIFHFGGVTRKIYKDECERSDCSND